MIHRFYVHNFRCLENFELPITGLSSALLIGRNGAGKSSVSYALEILQRIGRGVNRVGKLIELRDVSHGRFHIPVRFEIEVDLGGVRFEYTLAFELPEGFRELRVLEEQLKVSGQLKFSRQVAEMKFPRDNGPDGSMSIDWHLVGLPLVQARSITDPVHIFQQWLGKILILRPIPKLIKGESFEETLQPHPDVSNLGDWWTGMLSHAPSTYARIDECLRQLLPDLKDIKNPLIAKDARSLSVQFADDENAIPVPFEMLSDGEKCMVIWALTMAANVAYGPLFCFWDEPDNYLAISEIGNFTADLRKSFQAGGQFIATSHNAETIKRFSDSNTFILSRRNHLEPTKIRSLEGIDYDNLVGSLVRGEIL